MAEVNVVKPTRPERTEPATWLADIPAHFPAHFPTLRGNLFSMNPFALMKQFAEEMDHMFVTPRTAVRGAWTPVIEVKQKEGKLLVTADLPGINKEDVKVHVENGMLVIEGERKEEKEEKREGFFHSERTYGSFYRSIPLPEGAKFENTAAQFNHGVLEVTIPLPETKPAVQNVPIQEGPK
jgi:HSP20 family protein